MSGIGLSQTERVLEKLNEFENFGNLFFEGILNRPHDVDTNLRNKEKIEELLKILEEDLSKNLLCYLPEEGFASSPSPSATPSSVALAELMTEASRSFEKLHQEKQKMSKTAQLCKKRLKVVEQGQRSN
eukprot:TRINITY_DN4545_c0_g3_i2.p1 TRINITY_DN4545_c0_g3~~TRINITY_DN4545_c0_g3_i2.p1  ORF type:complete len:150 (+),score=39.31 TRINITY_DN4545_c0_g3_i2:65-451(+)